MKMFDAFLVWWLDKPLHVVLLVLGGIMLLFAACGNNTPATCEVPTTAPQRGVNGVQVTLTNIPNLETFGYASMPNKCIEFDYTPTQHMPSINPIADLEHPVCRMLWCGGMSGGLATLWCH